VKLVLDAFAFEPREGFFHGASVAYAVNLDHG